MEILGIGEAAGEAKDRRATVICGWIRVDIPINSSLIPVGFAKSISELLSYLSLIKSRATGWSGEEKPEAVQEDR